MIFSFFMIPTLVGQLAAKPPEFSYDVGSLDAFSYWRYAPPTKADSNWGKVLTQSLGAVKKWNDNETIEIKRALDAARVTKKHGLFGQTLRQFIVKNAGEPQSNLPGVYYAKLVARRWRDQGTISDGEYRQLIPSEAREIVDAPVDVNRTLKTILRLDATFERDREFGEVRLWAEKLDLEHANEGELFCACVQFITGFSFRGQTYEPDWPKFKKVFPQLEKRFGDNPSTLALKCSYVMMFSLRVRGPEFERYFNSNDYEWRKSRIRWNQNWWEKVIKDSKQSKRG